MIGMGGGMGMIGEDADDDVGGKANLSESDGEGEADNEYFRNWIILISF